MDDWKTDERGYALRRPWLLPLVCVAGLAAGGIAALGYRASSPTQPAAALAIVVIDGDTIDVGGVRWRLTGFDTPETRRAKCADERALGLHAKARLEELLAGGAVALTPKGVASDRYGRRLGTLSAGGRDVGEVLIGEGLARRYSGGKRKGWCGQ